MKTTTEKVAVKKVTKVVAKKVAPIVAAKKAVTIPIRNIKSAKTTPKKITKVPAKKIPVEATNYNSFWMNDGQILNTLLALSGALKGMETAVYKYHTKNGRHDFANWVEDVLHDEACAIALRKAKTAKSAHTVVVKYLQEYSY